MKQYTWIYDDSKCLYNFSPLVSKNDFSFLISYGSCLDQEVGPKIPQEHKKNNKKIPCPRPRSRTKRSARTETKIICFFWLLQTTYNK